MYMVSLIYIHWDEPFFYYVVADRVSSNGMSVGEVSGILEGYPLVDSLSVNGVTGVVSSNGRLYGNVDGNLEGYTLGE